MMLNRTEQGAAGCMRRRRSAARMLGMFLVAFFPFVAVRLLGSEAKEFPEYQLKAAFLYNFAKFVTWPSNVFPNADTPLTIGIVGEDPFHETLRNLVADKRVGGRALAIKHFEPGDVIQECHLLFISRSEKERIPAILATLRGKSILTVSEIERFAQRGGMINLIMVGDRLRFEINPGVAEREGLKISSKLGILGIIVQSETAPRGQ